MKIIRIGYCYNNINDFPLKMDQPKDINAEWTSPEDIETLRLGFIEAGFEVVDIGNPKNLLNESNREKVDIVFSIAEMTGFRFRESIAGIICELFKIPYALSAPDVLMLALDKNITNLTLERKGVLLPEWALLQSISDLNKIALKNFPYILKPVAEGSSIGISSESIVYNKEEAEIRTEYLIKTYQQPVIIQKYLQTTEVTIGVIENNKITEALTPIIVNNSGLSDVEYKKNASALDSLTLLENSSLVKRIQDLAILIFRVIGCNDTARVDFKIDKEENIYFIEINPLTDYTPRKDFCKSAFASGYTYTQLLRTIIMNAWNRTNKMPIDSKRKLHLS